MQLTLPLIALLSEARASAHVDERVRDDVSASRVPSNASPDTDNAANAIGHCKRAGSR